MLLIHCILRQSIPHHDLPPSHARQILLLRDSPVHFFHAAQPDISVQPLTNRNTVITEELPPFLLHVKPNLGAFHVAAYRCEKVSLELRELSSFIYIVDKPVNLKILP
jgi:hypothetical protein